MSIKGKQATVGKNVGGFLYVHKTAIDTLSAENNSYVDHAQTFFDGEIGNWNVVRISSENVAFLNYEQFDEDAFPQLSMSISVDLIRNRIRETDYSRHANRPILHRKELLLASDDPRRTEFLALTQKLEKHGLFYDVHRIGYKNQWTKRLKEHGVTVNGHTATIKKPSHVTNEIDRHKTALVRYQLSQPVKLLMRHDLLKENETFFDYGCGRGDDLNGLLQGGYKAKGWDPHFNPDSKCIKSDVVNLGFVLNVIEKPQERTKALKNAWSLADKVLSIAVMPPSSDAIENSKPYGDGFKTMRGTFQKYFMQEQLKEYVFQALNEAPIAIAPGIFFVFKNKVAEQAFLVERYNRHKYKSVTIRPDRLRPTSTAKPLKSDVLKPQLELLWQEILDHGRFVHNDEIPIELADAFKAEHVSLKRAEQYCIDELIETELLEKSGADRREDLLVYFALEMFSGRKPYRKLPKSLQYDIKAFFDNHANAQIEARNLLFSTGDAKAIREACEEFANDDLGYIFNDEQMLLHVSVLDLLPPILRCYIGCSGVLYGDISAADLIKIHIGTGKLTLQIYDDFSKALPRLTQRVKIDMRTQKVRIFTSNDEKMQNLYMKSLYIPDDFENFEEQSKFDRSLQKLGLFEFSNYGPDAKYFEDTLREKGWYIDGLKLLKK